MRECFVETDSRFMVRKLRSVLSACWRLTKDKV